MNGQTGKLYSIVVPNNISQTTINMEKENILCDQGLSSFFGGIEG